MLKDLNFDLCVEFTIRHEGGFVDHPKDPGGRTIYGISERSHPEAWANGAPTLDQAKKIYFNGYWKPCRCQDLALPLALMVFDYAVNSGPRRAVQDLQKLLGVVADGVIGPRTIAAANAADLKNLIANYSVMRLMFLFGLSNFSTFGRGWVNRVIDCGHTAVILNVRAEHGC